MSKRRLALTDPVFRLVYRLGYEPARLWWRLRRPCHVGALVAIWTSDERLLLVRQSYRVPWTLPGGGVRRDETPSTAAARELAEEIGIVAPPDHLVPAFQVSGAWDYRRETVHVLELHLPDIPLVQPDGREIIATQFTTPADLARLALSPPTASYVAALRDQGAGNCRPVARF
jgi:8-oxo-dGTP pyrophosphatase MutT (NUDIX family)